jgi:hypothetical protein
MFVVERRGGYPWAEGFFNRNDTAPLPVFLANDGRPARFTMRISDDLGAHSARVRQVALRLVLFRAAPGDQLEVRLNNRVLDSPQQDPEWKDPQIFSPKPQPASGGKGDYKIDPAQKLLLLRYPLVPGDCRLGKNEVSVRVLDREPFLPGADIQIEKIEVTLEYSAERT